MLGKNSEKQDQKSIRCDISKQDAAMPDIALTWYWSRYQKCITPCFAIIIPEYSWL